MEKIAVLGIGLSGYSSIKYCRSQGFDVIAMDTRCAPALLEQVRVNFPEVSCYCGSIDTAILNAVDKIIISPGLSVKQPQFKSLNTDIEILGDVELFARTVKKPIIAITGSNGKSTVASLVYEILKDQMNVALGGNIGIPVLDLLDQNQDESRYDAYVLELSSFQLETTTSLKAKCATVLNISMDHMDRYDHIDDYAAAKNSIYNKAQNRVVDRTLLNDYANQSNVSSFGLDAPKGHKDFGLVKKGDRQIICRGGESQQEIMDVSAISLMGEHNVLNVIAAIAIVDSAGYSIEHAAKAVAAFKGLAHRSEVVANLNGIVWINDSKATNPDSAGAALKGIKSPIIWIAGGDAKGADFNDLSKCVEHVKAVIFYGRDYQSINAVLPDTLPRYIAETMTQVIDIAVEIANKDDVVLFSPACASFDRYKNFMERGEDFKLHVQRICA